MSHGMGGGVPPPGRDRLWWWISTASAVISLSLSVPVFWWHESGNSFAKSVEALYAGAELLLLHMPAAALEGIDEFGLDLLHISRALAIVAIGSTAVALLLRFCGNELRRAWRTMRGGHIIVSGFTGPAAQLTGECCQAGAKVVVIGKDTNGAAGATALHAGAAVVDGDPLGAHGLDKAGLRNASHLFAAMDDDASNITIAMRAIEFAKSKRPAASARLHVHVHVADPQLRAALRSKAVLPSDDPSARLSIFNVFENSARFLLRRYPLDYRHIRPKEDVEVQIIVVGFGRMGEAVLTRSAMVAHYANQKWLRATVIDRQASVKEKQFRERYPRFDQVCDAKFLEMDADDPAAFQSISGLCSDDSKLTTVIIACNRDLQGLSLALPFLDRLPESIPVLLRLNDESGLASLVTESGKVKGFPARITAFGAIRVGMFPGNWINEKDDVVAKELHADYVRRQKAKGVTAGKPNLRDWEKLADDFIDSNRQAADHVPVKLRAAGCRMAASGKGIGVLVKEFTDDEVELLAAMEHRRWMAERFLAGWRLGPVEDKPNRISPSLVKWEDLPSDVQDYDRNFVRILPSVLELVGTEIRR